MPSFAEVSQVSPSSTSSSIHESQEKAGDSPSQKATARRQSTHTGVHQRAPHEECQHHLCRCSKTCESEEDRASMDRQLPRRSEGVGQFHQDHLFESGAKPLLVQIFMLVFFVVAYVQSCL